MSSDAAAIPPRRDGLAAAALGLVLRLAVVAWAWSRIPPAADGTFYDVIARRIAEGQGYTWRWPDGTVTFAAHYPVGYPALVAASYRIFGAAPGSAMIAGALLGALGVFAVHRIVARGGSRRQAGGAAVAMAIHPGLLSYTPALMTEGITASLVAFALLAFVRAREVEGKPRLARAAALGVIVALATYVRPQSIVLAPLLAMLLPTPGATRFLERARGLATPAIVATALVFALVAPWTARNCERMGRCALVSVNGGWNLLIGTDRDANGSWAAVKVPPACRTVYDEAEKDACFGREAARDIAAQPIAWLTLVPKKLAATFDYAGAGPWYLHASNPSAFPYRAKIVVGAVEVFFERICVLLSLAAVARASRTERRAVARGLLGLTMFSAAALFTVHAYLAVLGLALALGILALRRGAQADPPIFAGTLVVLGSTLVIHAVFFGAGRYSLVTFPALVALAAFAFGERPRSTFDSDARGRAS